LGSRAVTTLPPSGEMQFSVAWTWQYLCRKKNIMPHWNSISV